MGGKAFKNTVPISKENGSILIAEIGSIMNELGFNYSVIGSFYKFPCNDLDIAFEGELLTLRRYVHLKGFNLCSLGHEAISISFPVGETFHQVDFFITDNLEYARAVAALDPDSKYKNVHKIMMIESVIKVVDTQIERIDAVDLRTRYHLDPYFGLMFLVQKRQVGSHARFKTLRTVKTIDNYDHILCRYFGEYAVSIYSFENVYNAVLNKYPEKKIEIFEEAVSMMKSCKIEIPHELAVWVNV